MQEHFIYLFFFLKKWLQIYFIMQSHWNFKQHLVHWSWCRLCMCNIWIYAFYEGMPWPHLVVHHLDLYVLRLIADREIRRESYLILRVVSGPQHCALYLPFWHFCSGIAVHLFQPPKRTMWVVILSLKRAKSRNTSDTWDTLSNVSFPLMVGSLSHLNCWPSDPSPHWPGVASKGPHSGLERGFSPVYEARPGAARECKTGQ